MCCWRTFKYEMIEILGVCLFFFIPSFAHPSTSSAGSEFHVFFRTIGEGNNWKCYDFIETCFTFQNRISFYLFIESSYYLINTTSAGKIREREPERERDVRKMRQSHTNGNENQLEHTIVNGTHRAASRVIAEARVWVVVAGDVDEGWDAATAKKFPFIFALAKFHLHYINF